VRGHEAIAMNHDETTPYHLTDKLVSSEADFTVPALSLRDEIIVMPFNNGAVGHDADELALGQVNHLAGFNNRSLSFLITRSAKNQALMEASLVARREKKGKLRPPVFPRVCSIPSP
jgi:hypothetical protein